MILQIVCKENDVDGLSIETQYRVRVDDDLWEMHPTQRYTVVSDEFCALC